MNKGSTLSPRREKKIRLQELVHFARGSARAKQRVVTNARTELPYGVERDYYKRVRDGVRRLHKNGGDLSQFAEIPDNVSEKRRGHILRAVQGFIDWAQREEPTYFCAPRGEWVNDDVVVPVAPELGVVLDGTHYLLKLNYTAAPTAIEDAELMAHIMHRALGRKTPKGCRMGILDMRAGRIIALKRPRASLDATAVRCAAELSEMWEDSTAQD